MVDLRGEVSKIFLIHERLGRHKKNRLKIIIKKFRDALRERISSLL